MASCIFKTLKEIGIMKDDKQGYKLNLFMDNCRGQNKNCMVLHFPFFIPERKYFWNANFGFLEKKHTKNNANCMYNELKIEYHHKMYILLTF